MKRWLSLLSLAAGAAAAQSVTATLSVIDQSALELRYDVPPACTALDFINQGIRPADAAAIRGEWQPLDDCARVDGQRVSRNGTNACTSLRFRIPATSRNLDRIYPWAYPIGGGFFAHTGVYAVAPGCGPVDWKFSAPGGALVVNGVPAGAEASLPATTEHLNDMPVLLLTEPPAASAGNLHMGPGFTPADQRFLGDTLRDITAYLHRALPGLELPSPYIVATVSPNSSWRGDVANRSTMRLSFPSSPNADLRNSVRGLIAHEASHLAQTQEWRDAWGDDNAMLKEGGAEFLRWSASAALGWKDRAMLRNELEVAVNDCLIASRGKSWKTTDNRKFGRTPYACGFAFHAIGLASRSGEQPASLALRDYYRAAQDNQAADFAQALECGTQADCHPRWLPRLGGDEPLAAVFADYARTPGAVIRPAAVWSPAISASVANLLMDQLMRADCNGSVSFYLEPNAVRIAAGPACKALRADMLVIGAEGVPLNAGQRASKAIKSACESRHQVTLNLKDGAKVNLACDAISVPAEVYAVDIDLALKRLTDAPPAPHLP